LTEKCISVFTFPLVFILLFEVQIRLLEITIAPLKVCLHAS